MTPPNVSLTVAPTVAAVASSGDASAAVAEISGIFNIRIQELHVYVEKLKSTLWTRCDTLEKNSKKLEKQDRESKEKIKILEGMLGGHSLESDDEDAEDDDKLPSMSTSYVIRGMVDVIRVLQRES